MGKSKCILGRVATVIVGIVLLAWNLPYVSTWLTSWTHFTPPTQIVFWITVAWFVLGANSITQWVSDLENSPWPLALAFAVLAIWGCIQSFPVIWDSVKYMFQYSWQFCGLGIVGIIGVVVMIWIVKNRKNRRNP